jgi:chromosome segregation ATPase
VLNRVIYTIIFLLLGAVYTAAQAQIVFNKTEHDFGTLAPQEGSFEHDFIFRNTGDKATKVLSVKSVQSALSFIYTRSEVLEGEYGFVKAKIRTDSLEGLFHDEVYITLQYGDQVISEVIYLRAKIERGGRTDDQRQFEDGRISTSVEVSPSDIETMEGFMGDDKLGKAQSEIEYLKKQVAIKSDLIATLSDDLFKKEAQEKENFERLAKLENTLRNNDRTNNEEALAQLDELTSRLTDMRSSDSLLRKEIRSQEAAFEALKAEADSAKRYAQNLSQQLQDRFKSEAIAMERAQRLEKDLEAKRITEQQQQAKIDSLNKILERSQNNEAVEKEIAQLEKELRIRKEEQRLQEEHANQQNERIQALKEQNQLIQQSADSLANMAASSEDENEALNKRLLESSNRIRRYELLIDSLQVQTSEIGNEEQASLVELDSLKQALSSVEQQDEALRSQINNQEQELQKLQAERDEARKNMSALERATTKQQEQAHELMYRLNGLAQKESEAQLEIGQLRTALKQSQYREDSTRQSVNELVDRIAQREASIASLSSEIQSKESELGRVRSEQEATQEALRKAQAQLNSSDARIDSLQQIVNARKENASTLENDIRYLQKQVLTSHAKQQDYKDRADELQAQLDNARLSNDLTFQELKGDVEAMRKERDRYKDENKAAEAKIKALERQLEESKRNEESAIAFAEALQENSNSQTKAKSNQAVNYRVVVEGGDQPINMAKVFKGFGPVEEYLEQGQYHYKLGEYKTFKEAIERKNALKDKGHSSATIFAYADGKRISLKEALERTSSN